VEGEGGGDNGADGYLRKEGPGTLGNYDYHRNSESGLHNRLRIYSLPLTHDESHPQGLSLPSRRRSVLEIVGRYRGVTLISGS
jgi:hypothetical protein